MGAATTSRENSDSRRRSRARWASDSLTARSVCESRVVNSRSAASCASVSKRSESCELCHRVLVRDVDGLAPQAQRLLHEVRALITEEAHHLEVAIYDVEVTRRQVRQRLGWSVNQVRDATDYLVELEYLVVSGGGRGRCRSYRLVADVATVPTPVRPVGVGGEVGDDVPPTDRSSASGGMDQLVPLVHESCTRRDVDASAVASYTEIFDRTSTVEIEP
jgi:hypothetical protein